MVLCRGWTDDTVFHFYFRTTLETADVSWFIVSPTTIAVHPDYYYYFYYLHNNRPSSGRLSPSGWIDGWMDGATAAASVRVSEELLNRVTASTAAAKASSS